MSNEMAEDLESSVLKTETDDHGISPSLSHWEDAQEEGAALAISQYTATEIPHQHDSASLISSKSNEAEAEDVSVSAPDSVADAEGSDARVDILHNSATDGGQLEIEEEQANLDELIKELVHADLIELPRSHEDAIAFERQFKEQLAFTGGCQICLVQARVARQPCKCQMRVCEQCLITHLSTQVSQGKAYIQCPGSDCDKIFNDYIVNKYLPVEMKLKHHKFLLDAQNSPTLKTCPRCSVATKVDKADLKKGKADVEGLQVTCTTCALCWCFSCQAPWHEGLSCKEHRREDKEFKAWTKLEDIYHMKKQVNARKCPSCKIYIQRASGCSRMGCNRCSTEFCYDCGKQFFLGKTERDILSSLPFRFLLGTHNSRLSLLGCPKTFLPKASVCRKTIRGSLFGVKLVVGLCALPVAVAVGVVVGVFVLPVAGTFKAIRHVKQCTRENQ